MRSSEDLHYYKGRAEQELRRAELADHPDAARAHYELAGYYLDLVHNSAQPPRPLLHTQEHQPLHDPASEFPPPVDR